MRMNLPLRALALVAMLTGCKGIPFFSRGEVRETPVSQGDFTQVHMEWKTHAFNGETLRGRLLVSPVNSALRVDRRLIENIHLSVESVVACDTGTGLGYLLVDVAASALRSEDVVMLPPGAWYGRDVSLLLFAEHATQQPLPQCFEAELVYHALDIKNAGRIRVRVERSSPVTPGDAGTP